MPNNKKSILDEMEGLSPKAREWLAESLEHEQPDTDTQKAFWKLMTTQRIANIAQVADDWADMSPEAREFFRHADKRKIEQLDRTLGFMQAAGIIGKFLWICGATAFAIFIGFTQIWDAVSKWLKVSPK